ncbi:MAG TPA: hypothetical protein VL026_06280, partial [Rhizomicrobium sp.]|nr:hypothetical protein [Rhizomicrobium sp.]
MAGDIPLTPALKKPARLRRVVLGLALSAAFVGGTLYFGRSFVAARVAELYLLTRGVPSSIQIARLDWNGLEAQVRLGGRRTPDLSIGHVRVVFDGSWVPSVRAITVSHSVLRLGFDGEKLSFGTLQRLVDSLAPEHSQGPLAPSQKKPLRVVL